MYVRIAAATSEPQTPAQPIDYNFARDEIMLNELSNDPIQTAISRLEKQHEEDKQGTLSLFYCLYIVKYNEFHYIRILHKLTLSTMKETQVYI